MKTTIITLIALVALIAFSLVSKPKTAECAWCGTLKCLSSSSCLGDCSCLSDGIGFGKCLSVNVKDQLINEGWVELK